MIVATRCTARNRETNAACVNSLEIHDGGIRSAGGTKNAAAEAAARLQDNSTGGLELDLHANLDLPGRVDKVAVGVGD
jgi:hypothetical protein